MLAAVRYCGCCNPQVDVERAGWTVVDWLAAEGFEVTPEPTEAGLLVLVAGCDTVCIERVDGSTGEQTIITVVGTALRRPADKTPLAQRLASRLGSGQQ
jgi:hypothetical protein